MQNAANECARSTRIVPDLPSVDDSLGPHGRIAAALVGIIRDGNTPSVPVGLRGKWGGGKSTVIRLVEQLLESDDSLILVFDAWDHKDDPLRRAFLDTVRRAVDARWAVETESIESTIERQQTSVVQLSWRGRFFLASLVTVPLSLALFDHWLRTQSGPFGFGFDAHQLLGLAVFAGLSLPFLFGWLSWLKPIGTNAVDSDGSVVSVRELDALLLRKAPSTTTRIERPWEVSSIEFADSFSEVVAKTLPSYRKERRLVIVLDNLDRLTGDDALRSWSALRPLFPGEGQKGPLDNPRMTLIVPYDPSAFHNQEQNKADAHSGIPTAVLEKSFPVSFRVPQPAISQWGTYVRSVFAEAFPVHDLRDREDAIDLYEAISITTGIRELPGPRDVKRVVNRCGSLHRQWCGEVDLAEILRFVERFEERWEREGLTAEDISLLDDSQLDAQLALWSGLEPSAAKQVVLTDELRNALVGTDLGRIDALSAITGSERVALNLLADSAKSWLSNHETLSMLMVNIGRAVGDSRWSVRVLEDFARSLNAAGALLLDPEIARRIRTLLDIAPDVDSGSSHLADALHGVVGGWAESSDLTASDIAASISAYDNALPDNFQPLALPSLLAAEVGLKMAGTDHNVPRLLDRTTVIAGTAKLLATSAQYANASSLLDELLPLAEEEASSVLSAVASVLRTSDLEVVELGDLFDIVVKAAGGSPQRLSTVAGMTDALRHLLNHTVSTGRFSEAAQVAVFLLSHDAAPPGDDPAAGQDQGEHEFDALVATPDRHHLSEHIDASNESTITSLGWVLTRASSTAAIQRLAVKLLSGLPAGAIRMLQSDASLMRLAEGLADELDSDQLDSVANLVASAGDGPDVVRQLAQPELGPALSLLARSREMSPELAAALGETIDSIPAEVWLQDLFEERELIVTCETLAESAGFAISGEFGPALLSYIEALSAGEAETDSRVPITNGVSDRVRVTATEAAWDSLLRPETHVDALVSAFGGMMLSGNIRKPATQFVLSLTSASLADLSEETIHFVALLVPSLTRPSRQKLVAASKAALADEPLTQGQSEALARLAET